MPSSPRPIVIDSLADSRVDVYRNVRDADMRGREGLFMAESELVLRRMLASMPRRVHSMLLSPAKFARLREAIEASAMPQATPIYVAELELIHQIAAFHVHRGVLAAGYRLPPRQLTVNAALGHLRPRSRLPGGEGASEVGDDGHGHRITLLVAEGITNVDNMGALFRNAAAFGVAGLVLDPACCDPLYRKAIRVSMGHVLWIPYAVCAEGDWPNDLARLKREWNLTLVAAEATERAVPLWQMPRSARTAVLFGSEGHGLSEAALACCDAVCAIPMRSGVESINVAVASAVVLYELARGGEPGA